MASSRIRCKLLFRRSLALLLWSFPPACTSLGATQQPPTPAKPDEKPPAAAATERAPGQQVESAAQVELLETKVRYEENGSSRKEIHARVKLNNETGARQFARLNFDYNRSFETLDVPLVRIMHASGGTADVLPSGITDQPVPAVAEAPAYQDVRRKTVRILGLQPGDLLEYRVVTVVTKAPLAPEFWLSHSFSRNGVVTDESFDLSLPASRKVQLKISPAFSPTTIDESGDGPDPHVTYHWKLHASGTKGEAGPRESEPDLTLTTFTNWEQLAGNLGEKLQPAKQFDEAIRKRAAELTQSAKTKKAKIEALYDFVSLKIATIDLPLGSTGFVGRKPEEVLSSGYGTQEDKFRLLAALANAAGSTAQAMLAGAPVETKNTPPRPSPFTHLLVIVPEGESLQWLDPSLEVAPLGVIASNLRGKPALHLSPASADDHSGLPPWTVVPQDLPFAAQQRVTVDAKLSASGDLSAKVHYSMRGDNELLLRVAFHQATKDKWKDLAQLLSISDGFRGQVGSVTASDPGATREPFTIDYEITMPRFVDWTKKPVRIPALLPQVGLPEIPSKPVAGAAASAIDLGTPLEVDTHATLLLPEGTTALTPTGTSVERDYATFASEYALKGSQISASRHIHFILRQVPADRTADYSAFVRAVQNDEAQDFTLEHPVTPSEKTNSATPKPQPPPNPTSPKP